MSKVNIVKYLKGRIQEEVDFLETCFLDQFAEVGEPDLLWEVEDSITSGRTLCEILQTLLGDHILIEDFMWIEESEETFQVAQDKLEGLKK